MNLDVYPICVLCRHYRPGLEEDDNVSKCVAFPEGIPPQIMHEGFDHRQPLDDEQVLFQLHPDATEEELEEWSAATLKLTENLVDENLGPIEEEA